MKTSFITLLIIMIAQYTFAQSAVEQELINLSKQKWQWMADKNVDELASLFHDNQSLSI